MKFTVSKTFTFEAAHFLTGVPEGHKCRRLHGHSYGVEVFFAGPLDPNTGFVVDYAKISEWMAELIEQVDHRNLNDIFGFETTAEHLGRWFFLHLAHTSSAQQSAAELVRVDVHETGRTCVRVER